jgi:hypothetical protein
MNLLALSPALKAVTGIAVGVAFAGAIAYGVSHGPGGSDTPKFNAGTLGTPSPTASPPRTPTPGERTATATPTPTPSPVPTSEATGCPADWQFYDNTPAQYSICFPPGWGFHSPTSPAPQTSPQVPDTRTISILSPEWFTYQGGSPTATAVSTVSGRVTVTISVISSKISVSGCKPAQSRVVGARPAAFCEDNYHVSNGEATVTPSGERHALKVFVPIATPPGLNLLPGENPPDELFIEAEGLGTAYLGKAAVVAEIIDSIRIH